MESIRPFLMFQGEQAEAAMTFYASLFPDTKITDIQRREPEGSGRRAPLSLAGCAVGGGHSTDAFAARWERCLCFTR